MTAPKGPPKFTGQKLDGTGLQYFNARYYDPAIGAFISPDTLVPRPMGSRTNVFNYNRYMSVRGQVMNMSDPTGNYSNDEIMQHFGCESWSCVEGNFNQGGSLAGAWGWLNVLQVAQDGDTVTSTMLTQIEGHPGSTNASLMGTIRRDGNGRIGVHVDTLVGSDISPSPLDGTYSHDAQVVCYTGMQCATQALDAASTGSAALSAVCLASVVGGPCVGVAAGFSTAFGATGTLLTAYGASQGEASWGDVGVGAVTTAVGGFGGKIGKGTVGVASSLFQWWWDQ